MVITSGCVLGPVCWDCPQIPWLTHTCTPLTASMKAMTQSLILGATLPSFPSSWWEQSW